MSRAGPRRGPFVALCEGSHPAGPHEVRRVHQ